jgi:hypothetical protein
MDNDPIRLFRMQETLNASLRLVKPHDMLKAPCSGLLIVCASFSPRIR